MRLARIILPIPPNTDVEPMEKTAFVLAQRFSAEVIGLYATMSPREQLVIQDEAGAPMQLESLIKEAEAQADEAKQAAEKRFKDLTKPYADVTARFVAVEGNVSATISRQGRLADVTVIGTMADGDGDPWVDIRDAAIFQTGRPVVVAPREEISDDLGKTLVIAWKDGVEAARAMAAARPFLAQADKVRIISAGSAAEDTISLERAAGYVSLFGVDVETATLGKDKRNVGEILVEDAASHPGALMVMGAYSQWRWKEWAFGGVTEYVLHSTKVPALIAH